MSKLTQAVLRILLTFSILFAGLASTATVAYAAGDLEITIAEVTVGICGQVSFEFAWENGTGNDRYSMDFGNGDITEDVEISESTITIPYEYLPQGDYQWTFTINDVSVSETLTVEGPKVTLISNPFPAIIDAGNPVPVIFTANVDGGSENYTYEWDLNGGTLGDADDLGIEILENQVIGIYTVVERYHPQVSVTDNEMCDYKTSDTIPVVVVADLSDVCHPMAQKISDGVNLLLLTDQSRDLYTCDDIYALFDNESEENNLGFGQMWKAYNLAESMEELTWEDILDWKLNESGWGTLLQLNRFADLLGEHDLPELMGLVMSDEYSLGDVRTAVRSVTRYGADFEDALAMILEGANTGDINQAYKLATDEVSATDIMDMGVQEYRESLREEKKVARELHREEDKAAREEKQTSRTEETAEKLAEQFTAEFGDVMSLLNGECEGDWACVRKALRDQEQEMSEGYSDKDQQTALQIGSKYGFDEEVVLKYHKDECGEDWACTRSYFREQYITTKETGKPKNK